ncbi:MAG: apolipoprotein N-acyltransferase [Salinibacterium sp.]|nr:apolipoprotein N-acyltransferase [Salinibacterium sp.]
MNEVAGTTVARPLPFWAAVLVAAASGPVLDAGFPDREIWPLTFVGIGLVLITLIGRSVGGSLIVGFVAGAAFYFSHIAWASLFLGPLPMSALAILQSLFFAMGALAITLVYRWMPKLWSGALARLGLLPVMAAGLWTAREAWASVWPYGGFAWGRVSLSQSDSPIAPLFAWLGISGVSFVMVLVVAATIEAVRFAGAPRLVRAAVPVTMASLLLVLPAWPVVTDGEIRVAAVQGNARAGYFDKREPGELLQSQVDATAPLFGQDVDVVLWPEGASERSPLTDDYTASVFDFISEELSAPLVGWAVTERNGKFFNSILLWEAGEGALDIYDKKHPVPFGEYVPDREFWEPLAPDLIGLIEREYTPFTKDMVVDVDVVLVGVNICLDIVDDQLLTESVEQGARVIFASSNNADFGRTDESAQQLAIAQIRAIELQRSVVNISTVGLSAVIAPDGTILAQLPWFEPGTMVENVPLSSVITPAARGGRELEWFVSGLALGALAVAGFAARRRGA